VTVGRGRIGVGHRVRQKRLFRGFRFEIADARSEYISTLTPRQDLSLASPMRMQQIYTNMRTSVKL